MYSNNKILIILLSVFILKPNHYIIAQSPKFLSDSEIKYFVGKSNPDNNWNTLGYNDSSWETGYYSVGYGDNDDYTLIGTTTSVYARIPFYIENKENISDLIMLIDYDDGFVAYINGIEFARANLGKHGSTTTFDQLSDRSHEAESYRSRNGLVLGYYVDDSIIDKYIQNGKNYLAVEVHNDSVNGSDLTLDASILYLNGFFNIYNLNSRYKRSVELDSTHLPIIIIETDEFGVPYKRIEVPATITVIDNGPGKYNKPDDTNKAYSGLIEIEQRGQSSADYPKKSYDFETQDANGNDTNIALCGLPKENDWVLQGPFADKSQIRNALIYELGRKSGRWHPRVKFVEVIFNGEYIGLYNLVEKIKRDRSRIYIKKLKEDEISGNDLTGGYIVKYDKGSTKLQIVYPKKKDIQPEQTEYINGYFSEYKSALYSNNGLDPVVGYAHYIDKSSFIDYTVISEFSKNCDSYLYSTYMFKDRSDINPRIQFGPLWDFDLCFGNAYWQEGNIINKWQFEYGTNTRFYHKRLFEDPSLVDMFENKWFEVREGYLHTDSVFKLIDNWIDTLSEPIKRNYLVWPIITKPVFIDVYQVNNYDDEITHIKQWIDERTQWIDDNISDIYYPVTQYESDILPLITENIVQDIYPNPISDYLTIKLNPGSNIEFSADLISMDGLRSKIIPLTTISKGEYYIHWNKGADLKNGLYILEININGKLSEQYKILKIKNLK